MAHHRQYPRVVYFVRAYVGIHLAETNRRIERQSQRERERARDRERERERGGREGNP